MMLCFCSMKTPKHSLPGVGPFSLDLSTLCMGQLMVCQLPQHGLLRRCCDCDASSRHMCSLLAYPALRARYEVSMLPLNR